MGSEMCIRDRYQFRRWTALSTLPISASLDLSYGPNENSMRLIDRVPHTRNHAVCRSLIWADPEPATVAYAQVTMGPAQQRWVQLTFQGSAQARPATWDTFVLSDTVNFSIVGNPIRVSDRQYNVRVQTGNFTGDPKSVAVSVRGTVERRREIADRELRITENDTQDAFGPRTLLMPSWFPGDYDGIFTYTRPWLRHLSQPPQYLTATYPEWQDTQGRFEALRDHVQPGNAVNATVIVNDTELEVPVLVLAIEIRGGYQRVPTRTVFGIRRTIEPTQPLDVRIVDVQANSATALVGVANPSDQTIYGRFQRLTRGRLEFIPFTPRAVTAAAGEVYEFDMLTLAAEATRTCEFSLNADFSDSVTATFTTLAPPELTLAAVTVNGADISGWDFRTVTEFDYNLSFESATGTFLVTALPLSPPPTVTVEPASRTGITDGTTVTVTITATDGRRSRVYTLRIHVRTTPATPVSPPTGTPSLTLAAGNGRIDGSWTTVSDATSYEVQVTDSRSGNVVATATVTALQHIVAGLTNGVLYRVRVRGRNDDGIGPWSGIHSAVPTDVRAPTGRPTLTLSAEDGSIDASWGAVASATDYEVQHSRTTDAAGSSTTTTATSLTIGQLVNGVRYYVRVRATNSAGAGPWSFVRSVTPESGTPPAPAAPRLSPGDGEILATHTAVTGATGYVFQLAANSSFTGTATEINVTPTQTGARFTNLVNGQTYWARVAAVNAVGQSPWSTAVSGTPQSSVTRPTAAPTLSLSPGDGQIRARWTSVADATEYEVQHSTGFQASGNSQTTSQLFHDITGLDNGTRYWVRVRARNSAGNGPWSTVQSTRPTGAVVVAPTAAPTLTLDPGDGWIVASWSSVFGATAYETQHSTSADASGFSTVRVTRSRTITGLINNRRYYVRVRGRNSAGVGPWSAIRSATPSTASSVADFPTAAVPRGVSSQSNTSLWVATGSTSQDARLTRYNPSTGAVVNTFAAVGSGPPRGCTYVNTYVHVVDSNDNLRVYNVSGARFTSREFDISAVTNPAGITSDGSRFYIADAALDKVFVYTIAGSRRSAEDFDLPSTFRSPVGITYGGGYLWIIDNGSDRVFRYSTSGAHLSGADFDLAADNRSASGIGYGSIAGLLGPYFFVSDSVDGKIYVYDSLGNYVGG